MSGEAVREKSVIIFAWHCGLINEVPLLIVLLLEMQVRTPLMLSLHPSLLPHLLQDTVSSNIQNLQAPVAGLPQGRTFSFFLQIPFLTQQVAKFHCLLPGEQQETAAKPTEPRRTMTSSLHLPMVRKHQLDPPNHDPEGLHQKFITESPMGPKRRWKMSMQKLQNSWERGMPLKR